MKTKIIEATQGAESGPNHGKFMVGRLTREEYETPSALNGAPLFPQIGYWDYDPDWLWVLDLQTREGAYFHVGRGFAVADLDKHKIWVCPMFEPFLEWLYTQDTSILEALPTVVELPEAPAALAGYRRPGASSETPTEDDLTAIKDVLVGWCRPSTDAEKLDMIASVLGVDRKEERC